MACHKTNSMILVIEGPIYHADLRRQETERQKYMQGNMCHKHHKSVVAAYHSQLPGCKSIYDLETPHEQLALAFDPQESVAKTVFSKAEGTENSFFLHAAAGGGGHHL